MPASATPPEPRGVPLGVARAAASRLLGRLERSESALRLAVAGEARRMRPWVRRLELLATAHEAGPLLDLLAEAPGVAALLAREARTLHVRLADGLEVRLEVLAQEDEFGPALLRATGPAESVALLETRARAQGLDWRGHSLRQASETLALWEEAEVYEHLGLDPTPPERRERQLPGTASEDLVGMAQIVGAAGLHARPGRGRYSLAEMAARAEREGYAWSLVVAAGSDPGSLASAQREAEAWNAGTETRAVVRLAVEVDGPVQPSAATGEEGAAPLRVRAPAIGPDGALAAAVLAAEDPHADVLWLRFPAEAPEGGAGSGAVRDLLRGLVATGAALACSPPPHHARPEPDLVEAALQAGVPLLLWADARDLLGVDDLVLSVGLARRAGAHAEQVLNTLDLAGLDAWVAARRTRAGVRA